MMVVVLTVLEFLLVNGGRLVAGYLPGLLLLATRPCRLGAIPLAFLLVRTMAVLGAVSILIELGATFVLLAVLRRGEALGARRVDLCGSGLRLQSRHLGAFSIGFTVAHWLDECSETLDFSAG